MSQPTMQEMLASAKKIDDNLSGEKPAQESKPAPKKAKSNAKPKAKKAE